jgi:hypothetical protein
LVEPLAEAEGEVASLLHGPLSGRAGGDAAEVYPAGAVLDETQDGQSLQQDSVDVHEVGGEGPGGLAERNCRRLGPERRGTGRGPRRAGSLRRWTAGRRCS